MNDSLTAVVIAALEDIKGQDIVWLDVRGLTDVTDTLVVASGSSTRQVKALAENAVEEARKVGVRPLGVEGMETAEWVLVDFGDLVLHVMLPATRAFYELEKLWSLRPEDLRRGEE
jgi:ribosome-associated protein